MPPNTQNDYDGAILCDGLEEHRYDIGSFTFRKTPERNLHHFLAFVISVRPGSVTLREKASRASLHENKGNTHFFVGLIRNLAYFARPFG
jgi:hypothetical protein